MKKELLQNETSLEQAAGGTDGLNSSKGFLCSPPPFYMVYVPVDDLTDPAPCCSAGGKDAMMRQSTPVEYFAKRS